MIFGRRRTPPLSAAPALSPRVPPFVPDAEPPDDAHTPVEDVLGALRDAGVDLPSPRRSIEMASGRSLHVLDVEPGYPAVHLWNAVRAQHQVTGWWPLLTGSTTWPRVEPDGRMPTPGDGAQWMHRAETIDSWVPRGDFPEIDDDDDFDTEDTLAILNEGQSQLTLLPAPSGWAAPGLLAWSGAVNYDRTADEHATVLRRWEGLYGIELVGLAADAMIFRAGAPITDRLDALDLAVEAAAYCPDVIGSGTLETSAALLMLPAFTLWWD